MARRNNRFVLTIQKCDGTHPRISYEINASKVQKVIDLIKSTFEAEAFEEEDKNNINILNVPN